MSDLDLIRGTLDILILKSISGEPIRAYVPQRMNVLGTDGYGRSDGREKLRSFFEVDRYHVTVAALSALRAEGQIDSARVAEAIAKYGLDPDKPAPQDV